MFINHNPPHQRLSKIKGEKKKKKKIEKTHPETGNNSKINQKKKTFL